MNFQNVLAQLQKIGKHAKHREDCGIEHLRITGVKRCGFKSIFSVMCTLCHYKAEIHNQSNEAEEVDSNQGAVNATILCGGSYAQLEHTFAGVNIRCMSKKEFVKNQDEFVKSAIAAAEKEMLAAAEEEKRLAIERGDVLPGSGTPHIPVVADGSWMKRSYRSGCYDSASGVGVIVGYHTKKKCRIAAKNEKEPRKHTCFKNWKTSRASTAMESDAIVEGFNTSVEKRGLVYSTLIADGDSSVYKKIIDADPYKRQIRVKKIECTNHLLRNFCTKMKAIVKKTTSGPLRQTVESSIRRMRTDIVKAAKFRYNQNVSIDERTKNLYGDIQNVPSHVFGEHAECARLEYFCDGKNKENEKNIVPDLMKIGVYQDVKKILRPLLAHAESLLYNTTNNAVESLNGLIAKYTGGKRLNFVERGSYTGRCAAAVVEYNSNQVHSRLDAVMKKKTPEVVHQMEEKKKKAAKQKETKAARYVRKHLPSQKDCDYGQNAQKPDMPSEMYELERKKHMQMLCDWQEKRHAIEDETIGQAKNRKWLQYRSKLLTASNFGQVCRRRPDTLCANTVKSILYPKIISAPAVEYGKECENIAREELKKQYTDIAECGFFIDTCIAFLGASPDGIIGQEGILEIKCPKSAENFTPEEAIEQVPAVRRMFTRNAGISISKTHHYFYQIQGQLHITDRKYCIFCLWTPKGLKSIKVQRDDAFWKREMEPKLVQFYLECMLPELIDSRHNRCMTIREPQFILAERAKEKPKSLKKRKRSPSRNNETIITARRRTAL
ncbi:uncharacterized protein LOC143367585 [Andrena cerasifolii]|uniref:uncharacterized protein LOC143367585 n=1 Tax=Andrena cerasifolii TaxID=2819439 RepID=UPI0040378B13